MTHCTIPDCPNTNLAARGWCWMHYGRWRYHGDVAWEPDRIPAWKKDRRTDLQRFFEFVRIADDGGCWSWVGSKTPLGYGVFSMDSRKTYVHRWLYEQLVGPIPEGLTIDHLCRNRPCVFPDHLEPVTQRENIMRSPVQVAAVNARKTHCPQRHPYNTENTYHYKNGRYCKACSRAYYAENKPRLQKVAAERHQRKRQERMKTA